MNFRVSKFAFLVLFFVCVQSGVAAAEKTRVATAANFTSVAEVLIDEFHKSHPEHEVSLITGSTGKIFAQILHGAPFDIFLSADRERPEELEQRGIVTSGNRFTFASGLLVLWSTDPSHKELNFKGVLQDPGYRKLAIANPELAPYGAAAMKIIEDLKLANTIHDRVVMGENVGQTYALVASGNAELGFVALSQTRDVNAANKGTIWMVPPDLQEPIPQDAALLKRAEGNVAAKAFFDYLQSDDAKNIIRDAGYHVE